MFNTPEGEKFLRRGSIVMIALAVFLLVQVIHTLKSTSYLGRSMPVQNVVSVNGFGEVLAAPDVAVFSFGVRTTAQTVAEAQESATSRINRSIELVKNAGVEDRDIRTVNYYVGPRYEYSQGICTQFSCPPAQQRLVGYEVNQTVEVKVRDTSNAGSILSELGAVGVTDISGLNFVVDDEDVKVAEAREMAIKDAKEKAKVLAKDLGVKLGRVISFSEGYYPMPYYRTMSAYGMGGDAEMASAPRVPTGENSISSSVTVTYEIR